MRLGELQEGRLGDATAAQEAYESVLERDPDHRGALEAVARIAEQREDWERAAGALAKLVELAKRRRGRPVGAQARRGAREDGRLRGRRGGAPARPRARADQRRAPRDAPPALGAGGEVGGARGAPRRRRGSHRGGEPGPQGRCPGAAAAAPQHGQHLARGARRRCAARWRAFRPAASMPPPPSVPGPILEQVKLLKAAADIHLVQRKVAGGRDPGPRARGAAHPARSRSAPCALRRVQRGAARARRGAGPRAGHRVVRQPAHEGARALPPPSGARARAAGRQGRRARAARHGVQDRSRAR